MIKYLKQNHLVLVVAKVMVKKVEVVLHIKLVRENIKKDVSPMLLNKYKLVWEWQQNIRQVILDLSRKEN